MPVINPFTEVVFFNACEYEKLVSDNELGHGGFSMVHQDGSLAIVFIEKENYAVSLTRANKLKEKKIFNRVKA